MNNEKKFLEEVRQAHHNDVAGEKYHKTGTGSYLRNMVYGANDGIITTFAVVAGVAGAGLSPKVILILGFANLIADGMAMAAGNYLGTKSENEFQIKERALEEWEVKNVPEEELEELKDIYRAKGFSGEDLEQVVRIMSKNKKVWVDEMMIHELGIIPGTQESPTKNGAATFIAFVIAGLLPLVPFVLGLASPVSFRAAMVMTAAALFTVGALRTIFIKKNFLIAGLEMLGVGAIAAAAAYGLGYWIESLV